MVYFHGHIVRLTSALYDEEPVNLKAELFRVERFLNIDIESSHDI